LLPPDATQGDGSAILIERGWIDRKFIEGHTSGFDQLAEIGKETYS